jgi:hypothetical protein
MKALFKRIRQFLGKLILSRIANAVVTHDKMIQHADGLDRLLLLSGRQACRQIQNKKSILNFEDVEFRVFSQWGEDGIIEWILQNLPIRHKTFIEFGVENYREANTRFLIENRNWKGLVMDGSEANMRDLSKQQLHWMFDIIAATEFITRENINQLIKKYGFSGDLGILSIDIDGNDYWVMEAIDCVHPSIIICEYNPIFGDLFPVVVPYAPLFNRLNAHYSGLYFGASIAAVKKLAERKGYEFLGTNSNGINAFFVRRDLFPILEPLIAERKAFPSRHRNSYNEDGDLSFAGGLKRYNLIKHLPVVHVDTGEQVVFETMGFPYSQEWLEGMSVNS